MVRRVLLVEFDSTADSELSQLLRHQGFTVHSVPDPALTLEFARKTQPDLFLIAGPSLWGELARLYGILGNDEQRPLVDEQLLIQILEGQIGRHEVARELDRDAPLLRNGSCGRAPGGCGRSSS